MDAGLAGGTMSTMASAVSCPFIDWTTKGEKTTREDGDASEWKESD
jgi:hypothetical protein